MVRMKLWLMHAGMAVSAVCPRGMLDEWEDGRWLGGPVVQPDLLQSDRHRQAPKAPTKHSRMFRDLAQPHRLILAALQLTKQISIHPQIF